MRYKGTDRFCAGEDIIRTNVLTKFHEERSINVTYTVLTRKNVPPGGHIFQPTGTIFELFQDIIGKNPLANFHEDLTINMASTVLTDHVFQPTKTIFKLFQDIMVMGTNLLIKFHDDWTKNVASRVLTRFYYSHIKKNSPSPGGHVFQPTGTIFNFVQYIIGTNLLTNFHKDRTINVAYRVLTRKNAPPPGGNVFKPTGTNFELVPDFRNHLTTFHEDGTINVASCVLTRQMLTTHKKAIKNIVLR
ncbi:hypothetical protein DPMN_128855 [Dreissena polymorpha]|uniref:Uncharacterized protein n=1 Tax=Dreissena polymorpha TaxID=45954 RepID=A0A9D4H1L2_DREPO|nr:hypothetical protein DPMN_128855 [Dreissena polymorpha]